MLIRLLVMIALLGPVAMPATAAGDSLGQAIKKIFSTPTPTPAPRHGKKKHSSTAAKRSRSPSASTGKKKSSVSHQKTKGKASGSPSPKASRHHEKKSSVGLEPFETPKESPSPSPTPSPRATPESSPSPGAAEKRSAYDATLTPEEIKGFSDYPPKVQSLLLSALALTKRNLDYKYGSADPANGGMDCSGFVYFVLRGNGIDGVPRDSSEQYVWVRKAHDFEAVLSRKEDSFELEDLKPGDLLFWTGTYSVSRDPPVTHAMIYLGRERKTGQRVMVGASDGRVYHGKSRYGVSVFDFKIHTDKRAKDGKLFPTFVGYAHIPGLRMQKSE
jgi:peptidoglycan DL-endopeptidase CwlO